MQCRIFGVGRGRHGAALDRLLQKSSPPRVSGANPSVEILRVLLTEIELLQGRLVTIAGGALQIIEKLAAAGDQHQEAATRGVILRVGLQVIRELIDTRGQHCDLHVGTARILLMHAERLNFLSVCHIEIYRAAKYGQELGAGK